MHVVTAAQLYVPIINNGTLQKLRNPNSLQQKIKTATGITSEAPDFFIFFWERVTQRQGRGLLTECNLFMEEDDATGGREVRQKCTSFSEPITEMTRDVIERAKKKKKKKK